MSNFPAVRAERLAAIRADIAALARSGRETAAVMPFGIDALDSRLAGQGLAANGLHEIGGDSASYADDAAATLFVAGIAARAINAPILWVSSKADLFAPALPQVGLSADRLIQVHARVKEDALAVAEEALRHGGLAAVVAEVARIGMTASRRLQLAAEEGNTMALLLRRWRGVSQDPLAEPSAAMTRWKISAAPSTPLPVAGVGRPQWSVALIRQRGGDPWTCTLEACDAQGRLALPALSRNRSDQAIGDEKRRAA
jgi:protein ImuA